MKWFIAKKHLVCLIGLLAAAILLLLLNGCATTKEATKQQEETVIEHKPTPDGGYIERRRTYGTTDKTTTTQADVDWSGAILKGVGAAASGDWAALGGVAGTIVMAGGAAYLQHRRVQDNKSDANEGWAKYEAAMKDKTSA